MQCRVSLSGMLVLTSHREGNTTKRGQEVVVMTTGANETVRTCEVCGEEFAAPRRGRPATICSDERCQRQRNAERQRKSRASAHRPKPEPLSEAEQIVKDVDQMFVPREARRSRQFAQGLSALGAEGSLAEIGYHIAVEADRRDYDPARRWVESQEWYEESLHYIPSMLGSSGWTSGSKSRPDFAPIRDIAGVDAEIPSVVTRTISGEDRAVLAALGDDERFAELGVMPPERALDLLAERHPDDDLRLRRSYRASVREHRQSRRYVRTLEYLKMDTEHTTRVPHPDAY